MTCACGCGRAVPIAVKTRRGYRKGEPMRYVNGHNRRGSTMPESARRAISTANSGERNPAWRGDRAGYSAIHMWLRRNLVKTGRCSACGSRRRTHWANVSGEYRREFDDYVEMCVPCHKRADLDRRDALHDREMAAP